jgi:hypothetical protein
MSSSVLLPVADENDGGMPLPRRSCGRRSVQARQMGHDSTLPRHLALSRVQNEIHQSGNPEVRGCLGSGSASPDGACAERTTTLP